MNRHERAMAVDGAHLYGLRVYYEDSDAGGIVYHASYLRFCERARTEALRALGVPHAEMVASFKVMFVVRGIEVDYVRPARVDDRLVVATYPLAVGGASVELSQTVRDEASGLPVALLRVRLACADVTTGRAARMPDRWAGALRRMREQCQTTARRMGRE
jgi:acyl-CoA thioester hydrolase